MKARKFILQVSIGFHTGCTSFFFSKISITVQIKFVKPKKLKLFQPIDRSKYLANMQATIANGLSVSHCQVKQTSNDQTHQSSFYLCCGYIGAGVYFV